MYMYYTYAAAVAACEGSLHNVLHSSSYIVSIFLSKKKQVVTSPAANFVWPWGSQNCEDPYRTLKHIVCTIMLCDGCGYLHSYFKTRPL